jgi:hypothetical protein
MTCDNCIRRTTQEDGKEFCPLTPGIELHQPHNAPCQKWVHIDDEQPKKAKGAKVQARADNVETKARWILEHDDPMKYLVGQVGRMHIGDMDGAKKLILSTLVQNVKNAKGFHPAMHGESGKGKTSLAKAVKHVSPDDSVLETSLSGKALFYALIVTGVVVLCDDIELSDDLRTTLKRTTTNFTEYTTHTTVHNGVGKTLSIPPRVVWWLTSVDSDSDEQVLNREVQINVDDTPETDEAVFKHQLTLLQSGAPAMPEDLDILVAREMLRILKSEMCTVIIPFANRIGWDNKNNRRNFDVFGDILKAVALLHRYQRKTTKNDDDVILEATEADFEMAAEIYNLHGDTQADKLTNVEKKVVRFLGAKAHEDTDRYGKALFSEIQKHLGLSEGRTYTILHGRDHKGGLLAKVPGLYSSKESETEYDKALNEDVYGRESERKTGSRTRQKNVYILDTKRYDPFKDYSNVAYLKEA